MISWKPIDEHLLTTASVLNFFLIGFPALKSLHYEIAVIFKIAIVLTTFFTFCYISFEPFIDEYLGPCQISQPGSQMR